MSEAGMRQTLVKALRPLDAVPIENRAGIGTPDVNFIEGWIEIKWLRAWPKKAETIVTLDHPLLPEQRAWLTRRQIRGGKAWVMIQCRREWLLFDGVTAAKVVGTTTRGQLTFAARRMWSNGLDEGELIEELRGT